jgi:hypothetical protein
MGTFATFGDIVEENGKTIRENNSARQHKYPIGTLVEFEVDESHDYGRSSIKGTVRAFVCGHDRDCDGSPLYSMSMWNPVQWSSIRLDLNPTDYAATRLKGKQFDSRRVTYEHLFRIWFTCYGEESLTPVK